MNERFDKAEILRSVRAERGRTSAFLRALEPAQWETEALPGWRIREVVAHLISLDVSAVNGTIIPVALGSMDKLERWNDRQVPTYDPSARARFQARVLRNRPPSAMNLAQMW